MTDITVLELSDQPDETHISVDEAGTTQVTVNDQGEATAVTVSEQITRLDLVEQEITEIIEIAQAGPQGPTGPQGPQGPRGLPGTDVYYVHVQSVPSDHWIVEHSMGMFPSVNVVDSAGTHWEGDVRYISVDRLDIHWGFAFSGVAHLS